MADVAVDVGLAILLGLINFWLAWYSIHVFLERGKKRLAILVGLVGAVGLISIGVSTYRTLKFQSVTSASQAHIAASQQQMEAGIERLLLAIHAQAPPKHFFVGITEDVRTGKSSSFTKEISDEENKRRKVMLQVLRLDYFVEMGKPSPGFGAGTGWPPVEWINQRLAKYGESWTVLPGRNPSDFTFVEAHP